MFFDKTEAEYLGDPNAAIILANFRFWCEKNRANGKNRRDGRHWRYDTQKELLEQFPWMSLKMLRRSLQTLKDSGAIETGCYNKHKYDKTTWYSHNWDSDTIVTYSNDAHKNRHSKNIVYFAKEDAVRLGDVKAAVLLSNIRFWCKNNIKEERNQHEGKSWTYNTLAEFAVHVDWLTEGQVRGAIEKLEKAGAVSTGNFNRTAYDRTKWYACEWGMEEEQEPQRGTPPPEIKADKRFEECMEDFKRDALKVSETMKRYITPDGQAAFINALSDWFEKYKVTPEPKQQQIFEQKPPPKSREGPEANEIQVEGTHQDWVEHFVKWHKEELDIPLKINGRETKAIKSLREFFIKTAKERGESPPQLRAFEKIKWITSHWHLLENDDWVKENTTPSRMDSQINAVMQTIKRRFYTEKEKRKHKGKWGRKKMVV